MNAGNLLNRIGQLGVVVGIGGALLTSSVYVVEPGHAAIVQDRLRGIVPKTYGEGLHFRVPILQRQIVYETRTRPTNIQSETGTKDLQTVGITLRILYRPNIPSIPQIHQTLGRDYDSRVLPSLGNEVLKSVVAQYDALQLIAQRESVSQQIRDALTKRASDFFINLEDVSITHLSFSPEFAQAIERKQVAQQEAERSKYIVLKTEQEARASIIKAEGEAEAAKQIIQAMKVGPGFLQLRKIEAAREIAETLSRGRVTYLPSQSNTLLSLPPAASVQQEGMPQQQSQQGRQ